VWESKRNKNKATTKQRDLKTQMSTSLNNAGVDPIAAAVGDGGAS